MATITEIGIGLYGSNGHQIASQLASIRGARLVACSRLSSPPQDETIPVYPSLAELLADPQVDLVSLCSPVRADQAEDIREALRAGKHVYAEKPCVMLESDLNSVILLAETSGLHFFEMAGTAFEEPYATAREIVLGGELGTVVQITAQKSYPYADWRPQDEQVDGGLILQCGIHAVRMIEHAALERVIGVAAVETGLGNPKKGNLRMAASLAMQLASGAVASASLNYLNQPGYGGWSNEELRVFGTNGFLYTQANPPMVVVTNRQGTREIPPKDRVPYFQQIISFLLGQSSRPLGVLEETHPTRVVIRARESARRGGVILD